MRRVDSRPASNVTRSDGVGRPSEAPADAPEGGLIRTIPLVNPSPVGTRPRRVARIHQSDRHRGPLCLVLKTLPQWVECPTVLAAPPRLLNRDPVANARQIFEGNPAPGALGFRHQLFRNPVVFILRKAVCRASPLLEEPLSRLDTLLLQPLTDLGRPFAQAMDWTARVGLAVGVGGEMDQAEIHAQPVVRLQERRFGDLHHDGHVALPVAVDPAGLTADALPPRPMVPLHDDRHDWAPVPGQDRHLVHPLPRKDAGIVHDGPGRADRRLELRIPFVGFGDFSDRAPRSLRRQAACLAHLLIP